MRLFLLPISTRRVLIFCQHHVPATSPGSTVSTDSNSGSSPTPDQGRPRRLLDRTVDKAASVWATWERAEKGWRRSATYYGNLLIDRIPFEEWGLKSIPARPSNQDNNTTTNTRPAVVELLYPRSFISGIGSDPVDMVHHLAVDTQAMHRRRMWWSIVGMPIVSPFALVPMCVPLFLNISLDSSLTTT